MYRLTFFCLLLLTASGCRYAESQAVRQGEEQQSELSAIRPDTTTRGTGEHHDRSLYYTNEETALIIEGIDTMKLSKADYNRIVDEHAEFFELYPDEPDYAYARRPAGIEFSSEAGRDNYYLLYAHFVKRHKKLTEYTLRRNTLAKIYRNINSLFQRFQYGGTYFGHQSARIAGYTEYSVFLYTVSNGNFRKVYDISKQKALYIQSLRQLVADEVRIDTNLPDSIGKASRQKELNATVNEIERLITDNFYLRRAQEFHYRHYEYY